MKKSDKAFVKKIENKVKETIKKYKLFNKGEKILVAASGGKDSTTVLYILKKLGYNIEAVTIDVAMGSYTKNNLKNLTEFCKKEKINLYSMSLREEFGGSVCYIKSALSSKGIKLNSCAVCGVLRRYLVNKAAKRLKAKKLVTGHNLDDEAQSIMMNFFRNTLHWSARLGPKSGIEGAKGFIPRVKPLYFIPEKDIARYSKIMKFPVYYGKCPCSAEVFRRFTGNLLNDYEKTNPKLKENIADYFLKSLPKLKQKYKFGNARRCIQCGEPSKEAVCRACQIISQVKAKV
ncbi:TIGR00269 family protein [Candidatus Woesearchaeota archaeon]|nr:TIGR00269 family protein [Candidatus Woesearchaeota archaeon]